MSMRPTDFSCVLKVGKPQMQENGMKDATMDKVRSQKYTVYFSSHRIFSDVHPIFKVYGGILLYMKNNASKISFPEFTIPCVVQLKSFLKKCKVANYCKKMKQLVDVVEENSKHVAARRRNIRFKVQN